MFTLTIWLHNALPQQVLQLQTRILSAHALQPHVVRQELRGGRHLGFKVHGSHA